MIDKLVTIVFVCCAAVGIAQQKDGMGAGTPAKPEPVKIDYHQPGTEMPRVKLVSIDTLEKVLEGKDLKKAKKKYMKEFGYTPVTKVYTDNELDNGASIFMMMFNPPIFFHLFSRMNFLKIIDHILFICALKETPMICFIYKILNIIDY